MSSHVIVDLSKVLIYIQLSFSKYADVGQTATKKLEVPSIRSKLPGKSFIQVSSPYMTIFPVPFAFI